MKFKKGDIVLACHSASVPYSVTNERRFCVVHEDQIDSSIKVSTFKDISINMSISNIYEDVKKKLENGGGQMPVKAEYFIKVNIKSDQIDIQDLITNIETRLNLTKMKEVLNETTPLSAIDFIGNNKTLSLALKNDNASRIALPSIIRSTDISCGVNTLHPIEQILGLFKIRTISSSLKVLSMIANNNNIEKVPLISKELFQEIIKWNLKRISACHVVLSVRLDSFSNVGHSYEDLFDCFDYVSKVSLNKNSGNTIVTMIINNKQ